MYRCSSVRQWQSGYCNDHPVCTAVTVKVHTLRRTLYVDICYDIIGSYPEHALFRLSEHSAFCATWIFCHRYFFFLELCTGASLVRPDLFALSPGWSTSTNHLYILYCCNHSISYDWKAGLQKRQVLVEWRTTSILASLVCNIGKHAFTWDQVWEWQLGSLRGCSSIFVSTGLWM